jgi:hypothetical protein
MCFPTAQGREADNGQCSNPGHDDGHNLLWMAATGTPASVSSRDRSRDPTGVFMFFALLCKAIRENFPSSPEVLVVFDGEMGSAGRKAVDPGYKARALDIVRTARALATLGGSGRNQEGAIAFAARRP